MGTVILCITNCCTHNDHKSVLRKYTVGCCSTDHSLDIAIRWIIIPGQYPTAASVYILHFDPNDDEIKQVNLRVLLDPLNTLGDVLAEIRQAHIKELLLVVGDVANRVDLLNTVGPELYVGRKVLASLILVQWGVDEGGFDDILLALCSLEERLGEAGSSHSHGESG